MESVKTYDTDKAISAQKRLCVEKNYPDFAPLETGRCWKCKRNIFQDGGISVEEAASSLITGCPFCHWSYCE